MTTTAIFYSIAAYLSPLSDKIGKLLLIGLIVPFALLMLGGVIKIITSFFKYTNKPTCLEFEYKNHSIILGKTKDRRRNNIDHVNCINIGVKDKKGRMEKYQLSIIAIFVKKVRTICLTIDSYEKKQPNIVQQTLAHGLAVGIILEGLEEGKYKITFND